MLRYYVTLRICGILAAAVSSSDQSILHLSSLVETVGYIFWKGHVLVLVSTYGISMIHGIILLFQLN